MLFTTSIILCIVTVHILALLSVCNQTPQVETYHNILTKNVKEELQRQGA